MDSVQQCLVIVYCKPAFKQNAHHKELWNRPWLILCVLNFSIASVLLGGRSYSNRNMFFDAVWFLSVHYALYRQ